MERFVGAALLLAVVGCSESEDSPGGTPVGATAGAAASALPPSPLAAVRARIAAGRAPAAWQPAVESGGAFDPTTATTLVLEQDFELFELPGAAGRGERGLVVALRRLTAGQPLEPVAVASLPALTLLDELAPLASAEFPVAMTRRLVLLLDGLLRAALAGGQPPVDDFISVEGPPWRGGGWAPFLTERLPDEFRTASVRSFAVRAKARFALLAAVSIDLIDTPMADAEVGGVGDEPSGRDCLVLYRTLAPSVSGTAWGVAWIFEGGEDGG